MLQRLVGLDQLLVVALTQAADDVHCLADHHTLLRDITAGNRALGLRHAIKAALHEHLHQAVRAGFGRLRCAVDFLVLPKGQHRVHGSASLLR
ncbi:hypothetical protein D3C85_1763100 [compost metagenome]